MLTTDYPSEELKSEASTNSTNADFIYPRLVGNPTYIDGIAEGHFTLFNSDSGASVTVTDFTVTLKKTDNVPDNATTLGTYSNTISTENVITKTGDIWAEVDGGNDEEDTLVLPFYINIAKQKIDVDEKILLSIEVSATGGTMWIGHYNGSDPDDVKLRLPYVPAG